jgi:predicted nucleic acid-binding protein
MVIVDTTVWVDYLRGTATPQTGWLDRELVHQRLGLPDLVLCEVLQGVGSESEATRVLRALTRFEVFETGGTDLAIQAARNYRILRARGQTVRKTIDCLIATFCLMHGHTLLHADRDFDPFETRLGLRVVQVKQP